MIHILFSQPSTGDPIADYLINAGPYGILLIGLVGFIRGWIVPASAYNRCQTQLDRAQDLLYKQIEISTRALEVTEKTTNGH